MQNTEQVKKEKKQGGRPKNPAKKEIIATVRLDKSEHFIIRQKALKAGMSTSRYIRGMAIKGTVKSRVSEEEKQMIRKLVGISNNLNQLAKRCHQEGMLQTMIYFEDYRDQVDDLLKRIKDGK